MTTPQQPERGWRERFEEEFPPFRGVGARFPMFNETPVHTHIIHFIEREISSHTKELKEKIKGFKKQVPIQWEEQCWHECINDILALLEKEV